MTEAPKRIWAFHTGPWVGYFVGQRPGEGVNIAEYIRADLVEAAIKRAPEESQNLRVIVYKEGDTFIARCVQYDILTQGPDAEEIQQRMDRLMETELASGTCPIYTRADMEAAIKRALEGAAKRAYEDAGRFDTPDRIRALDPAQFIKEPKP